MAINKSYSIIANAALQFIDYDLDLSIPVGNKTLGKSRKPFHVAKNPSPPHNTILVPLAELEESSGDFINRITREIKPLHFEMEYAQAVNCCVGQWLPLPFLSEKGKWEDHLPQYGYGPTDWARIFVSRLGSEDSQKFRITLVFDPMVDETEENLDDSGIYHTLSRTVLSESIFFSLASHERDNAWFIENLSWVKEALRKSWENYRIANPKTKLSRVSDDFPDYAYDHKSGSVIIPEYMAVYMTLLEAISLTNCMRRVRVVDPKLANRPIDVDLVLDIGNSRLTGVLVETVPQRPTKLTDCYTLQVRDLSEPANIYAEPLDTKVEFSEPFFGPVDWSLDSRLNGDSFIWPSVVRLGPEANRLSSNSREEQGPTGMSSPKRYLWDTRLRDLQWYFNNNYKYHGSVEQPAVGQSTFLLSINVAGVPLSVFRDPDDQSGPRLSVPQAIKTGSVKDSGDAKKAAFKALYSRSSLMMFLLSEIIAQALSCINSPVVRDNREHPDTPRRLQSIIMTVPTAMPLAEQNIFKTWARLAVETVWSSLNWDSHYQLETNKKISNANQQIDFRRCPLVRCDWDEATCTQVVWLYNEISEKFHNNASELFDLLGRQRIVSVDGKPPAQVSTLRLASIDIGGGTTDLSITTYAIHNPGHSSPLVIPSQDFRDGFNVAGDDIMRKIIQTQFFGKLSSAALQKGVVTAEHIVSELFTDTAQMGIVSGSKSSERLRSQFVVQVAVPVALHILKNYEEARLDGNDVFIQVRVGDVLGFQDRPEGWLSEILSYVEEPLKAAGWSDFNLLDFSFEVDMREVDANASMIIEKIINDMGEIVKLYDCDMLILTGRPSRWPAIIRAPYARNFLPVDRIVHMHKYRVESGYPFSTMGRIEDPKTTVVVGAIICALAEGSLEGVTFDTSSFIPQPINRFVGLLDGQGRLSNEHVWFTNLEVDRGQEIDLTRTISFNAPCAIGFRQLNCVRWTTTRLYSLEYKNSEAIKNSHGCLPYTVTLQFEMAESEAEDSRPRRNSILKRTEGTLRVVEVIAKDGSVLPSGTLTIRLQTLRSDNGYWLDTGALENI